jgi:hypothetical protein
MSRLRFETALEVFEAFPALRSDIKMEPGADELPLVYCGRLVTPETGSEAVRFLAHTLPRREAVWWAARSVRTLLGQGAGPTDLRGVELAEGWVREPDEPARRAALEFGLAGDQTAAGTWAALAAAWSGGGLTLGEHTANAPADITGRSAMVAVTLASCAVSPAKRWPATQACLEAGMRFASGGDLGL